MNALEKDIISVSRRARQASRAFQSVSSEIKNRVLATIADLLDKRRAFIQEENAKDLESGKKAGLSSAMLDRLYLSPMLS